MKEDKMRDRDEKEASVRGAGGASGPDAAEGSVARDDQKITEVSEEIHKRILSERDEYLESLQRLQADFDNYRKRVLRESESSTGRVSAEIVEELLPVLDNFERALKAVAEHDEKVLGEGVALVYRQLREVLDRRGLCEIEAAGEDFDPEHHEAVLCQPSPEHGEGKVIDVLEKGYRVHDRVVRPAKVIVSDGDAGERKG